MRLGKSYSGNTLTRYIFVEEEEKKLEGDPSQI